MSSWKASEGGRKAGSSESDAAGLAPAHCIGVAVGRSCTAATTARPCPTLCHSHPPQPHPATSPPSSIAPGVQPGCRNSLTFDITSRTPIPQSRNLKPLPPRPAAAPVCRCLIVCLCILNQAYRQDCIQPQITMETFRAIFAKPDPQAQVRPPGHHSTQINSSPSNFQICAAMFRLTICSADAKMQRRHPPKHPQTRPRHHRQ